MRCYHKTLGTAKRTAKPCEVSRLADSSRQFGCVVMYLPIARITLLVLIVLILVLPYERQCAIAFSKTLGMVYTTVGHNIVPRLDCIFLVSGCP